MVKVIMMCGVCGSGKTTYALEKEKEGFVRLSIDEEMWKTYGRRGVDFPEEEYDRLSEKVERKLQADMEALIEEGRDVILDLSFWSRESRDRYRQLIRRSGGEPVLVYLKADKEVLRERLRERNKTVGANAVFVSEEMFEQYYDGFQEPDKKEL